MVCGISAAQAGKRTRPEPKLSIVEESGDFGKHATGEVIEKIFTFRNSGTETAFGLSAKVHGNHVFRFKGSEYPGVGGTCGTELSYEPGKNECTVVLEGSVIWPYGKNGELAFSHSAGRTSRSLLISGPGNQSAPEARTSQLQTEEDKALEGKFDAADPDGDSLAYIILQDGKHGSIEVKDSERGSFVYTPFSDDFGVDSILYKVSDGDLESKPARITVSITPSNDSPRAHDSERQTQQDVPFSGILRAQDVENDPLTFNIVQAGTKGNVSITDAKSGTYTYIPNQGVFGEDSFAFTANDGKITSNKATVRITIRKAPEEPIPKEEPVTPENSVREISSQPQAAAPEVSASQTEIR